MAKLYAMDKHLADLAIAGADLHIDDTDTI
jgi:hypothetical protein